MKKGALTVAFVHKCALTACKNPGVFVKGVQARQPENSLDNAFFSSPEPKAQDELIVWDSSRRLCVHTFKHEYL